jgi:hypothetical protein
MRRLLVLAVVAVVAISACTSNEQPDAARFCQQLQSNQGELTGGVANQADIATTVARYRDLEKLAPVAIRQEWQTLTDVVEQAATMDLTTADAGSKLADLAYSSEPAARTVAQWVSDTCGVALRPPLAPPTTGAPPASTMAPLPTATTAKPPTTARPTPTTRGGAAGTSRATTPTSANTGTSSVPSTTAPKTATTKPASPNTTARHPTTTKG